MKQLITAGIFLLIGFIFLGGKNLFATHKPISFFSHSVQPLFPNQIPNVGQRNFTEPLLLNNRMYFGTAEGYIFCYNLTRQQVEWRYNHGAPIAAFLLLSQQHLFVGDLKGTLTKYKLPGSLKQIHRSSTLTQLESSWSASFPGALITNGRIQGKELFFSTEDHQVYAVNSETGKQNWRYKTKINKSMTIQGATTPVIHNNEVILGFADGMLVSLDRQTGKVSWKTQIGDQLQKFYDVDASPVIENNTLFTASFDNKIVSLDLISHSMNWVYEKTGAFVEIVSTPQNPHLYVSSTDGHIIAIDKSAGSEVWRYKLKNSVGGKISLNNDFLAIGTLSGPILILSRADGKLLWQHDLEVGAISRPVIHNNFVFFLSNFSNLYLVAFKQ